MMWLKSYERDSVRVFKNCLLSSSVGKILVTLPLHPLLRRLVLFLVLRLPSATRSFDVVALRLVPEISTNLVII